MTKPQHMPRGEGELAALRTQRGFSQADLANAVGITRTQLASIEAGRSGSTMRTMRAMALALNVDVEDVSTAIARDYSNPRVSGRVPFARAARPA